MSAFLELDFDTWFDTYKPIPNNINPDSSFGGYMFETYGEEYEFVKKAHDNHIWMYGDGDDDGTYIWNGWGFVNRIGYFITEVPFSNGVDVQVTVSEGGFECPNCEAVWKDESAELMSDLYQELQKCAACATLEELDNNEGAKQ